MCNVHWQWSSQYRYSGPRSALCTVCANCVLCAQCVRRIQWQWLCSDICECFPGFTSATNQPAMEIRPEWKSTKNGNHENMAFPPQPNPPFHKGAAHTLTLLKYSGIDSMLCIACSVLAALNNLYILPESNVMAHTNDKPFNLLHSLSGRPHKH